MKDQYFGDVNDYRKYGLLRALQSSGDGSLLVAWMLTPDDGGRDGGLRSYLDSPARWAKHDRELFSGLSGLLGSAQQRSVSLIEGADLLPRASYYAAVVPQQRRERDVWSGGLLRAAAGVDLVFVDPDNGIEVRAKPVGRKGSAKYVTWGEIEGLWATGCSVLIYQHFRREPRRAFAERVAAELRSRTKAALVEAFRTPHVLFLLASQNRHALQFWGVRHLLSSCWDGQIKAMGLAHTPPQPAGFADG